MHQCYRYWMHKPASIKLSTLQLTSFKTLIIGRSFKGQSRNPVIFKNDTCRLIRQSIHKWGTGWIHWVRKQISIHTHNQEHLQGAWTIILWTSNWQAHLHRTWVNRALNSRPKPYTLYPAHSGYLHRSPRLSSSLGAVLSKRWKNQDVLLKIWPTSTKLSFKELATVLKKDQNGDIRVNKVQGGAWLLMTCALHAYVSGCICPGPHYHPIDHNFPPVNAMM